MERCLPVAKGPMARYPGDRWPRESCLEVFMRLPVVDVGAGASGLCSEVACPLQDGVELSRFLSKAGGHATLSTTTKRMTHGVTSDTADSPRWNRDKHHRRNETAVPRVSW